MELDNSLDEWISIHVHKDKLPVNIHDLHGELCGLKADLMILNTHLGGYVLADRRAVLYTSNACNCPSLNVDIFPDWESADRTKYKLGETYQHYNVRHISPVFLEEYAFYHKEVFSKVACKEKQCFTKKRQHSAENPPFRQ